MKWAFCWALHLCQLVVEEGVHRGGLPAERLLNDRAAAVPLSPGVPQGAAYVDNFLVMGGPRQDIAELGKRVPDSFVASGFKVHEETGVTSSVQFVGLELDGAKLMCHCKLHEACHADALITIFKEVVAQSLNQENSPPSDIAALQAAEARMEECPAELCQC